MIYSIRKFLLINLLLAITLTTTLTAIANYYWDRKDIERHMDSLMAISALSYQALLNHPANKHKLGQIQKALDDIPLKISEAHTPYLKNYNFRILSKDGELFLQQGHIVPYPTLEKLSQPHEPMQTNRQWRFYSTYNPHTDTRIIIAEHDNTRRNLAYQIAINDLYILFITFPLTGLLLWFIIGRGMQPLNKVTQEVANRAPNHLQPVCLDKIPQEIKPLVDELNHLFQRLQETFEREKRFAADAAHELRTPLAAIKAQAQVALNTQKSEEKDQALQKLIASVNRSTHTVQQLLTMSRLQPEAHYHEDFDDVDLTKVAREILVLLAPHAVEKNIELEFDAPPTLPIFKGNPTAIGILIRNLVDNAIRYSRVHGHVHVKIYRHKKEMVLEISDNGPGIPKELRSRVFERFFRVLGNKTPGSGLGLSIVREICDLHHGRVTLQAPKKGTGLIVKVFFPYRQL